MNITTLGSSSKGNCYIIKTSKETLIIEAGVTYKQLGKALDFDFSTVAGVLVSHEHKDHSKAVKDLAEHGIDVYTSIGTIMKLGITHHRIRICEAGKQFKIGEFIIKPFLTEHDAKEPYGYLIYHKEIGKLLFATDTFYIKNKFPGLNYIMVECNYSHEILNKNIEKGLLHPAMKRRLLTSHFSLKNVKKFLLANDLTKVREIYLIHLSDGNSNAAQFKEEIESLTGIPVTVC